MFEIKDPERGKDQQTEKREESVAPFHERDLAAQSLGCQSRNGKPLVDLPNRRQSAPVWQAQ